MLERANQTRVLQGDAATGDIALRRRPGNQDVTVVRLLGSVLMDATATGLPRTLDGHGKALSVPVSFTLASCDPHVLAETKQPYLFPLFLRFDGGPPQYILVSTSDGDHQQLQAMLRDACAARRASG